MLCRRTSNELPTGGARKGDDGGEVPCTCVLGGESDVDEVDGVFRGGAEGGVDGAAEAVAC